MQLFTQLWPAVIEILSVVLCDYCSNEFSMAAIFSLLVFSLQVKTCRIKMTKTTTSTLRCSISPNSLIAAVAGLQENSENLSPVQCFQIRELFLFHPLPQQPVRSLIRHLGEAERCQYFVLKGPKRLAIHNDCRCSVHGQSQLFSFIGTLSMANTNKPDIKY